MEQKFLISDYDDTITKGSEPTFALVCEAVLGTEEYQRIRKLPKNLGIDWFTRYIKEDLLTKEKAETLWENFKNTKPYQMFINAGKQKINEILEKGENMPSTDVAKFLVEELLFPLIAFYNVHVEKLEPQESFFELYEKSKTAGDILIINTFKPHKIIITELQEYVKLNKEKYAIFEEMINNEMVFGTTPESCKADSNRVDFLLKTKQPLLKTPTQEIIVMGDSFSDCVNFQEAYKINPNSKFLFVNERLENEIENVTEKANELIEHIDELEKATNKLKYLKGDLNKINEQTAKTPNNIKRINYANIVEEIYGRA